VRTLHCVHRHSHLLPSRSRSRSPLRSQKTRSLKSGEMAAQFVSVPSADPSGAERGREGRTCARLDGVDLEEQHHHAEEVGHVPRQPEHVHLRSPSFTFPPPSGPFHERKVLLPSRSRARAGGSSASGCVPSRVGVPVAETERTRDGNEKKVGTGAQDVSWCNRAWRVGDAETAVGKRGKYVARLRWRRAIGSHEHMPSPTRATRAACRLAELGRLSVAVKMGRPLSLAEIASSLWDTCEQLLKKKNF